MSSQPTTNDDSIEASLSRERKRLIHLYMTDLPGSRKDDSAIEAGAVDAGTAVDRPEHAAVDEVPTLPVVAAEEPRPRRRRGRPPGRRQRRPVHFHVDQNEDRLLLAAARQFGSQQKGLIAALHALQEVVELREQFARLQKQYDRQSVLLAEAEALFNKH
jgi:hypothetical protein